MNWLDIIVLAAVGFGALYGLNKGLVRLVFSLVGVVAGVILSGQYYQTLAGYLTFLPSAALGSLVAYFVAFLAVLFVATAVGEVLHAVLGLLVFGCFDQVLGLSLGAVVAALVVQSALLAVARFPIDSLQPTIADSTVARMLVANVPVLLVLLPPEFSAVLDAFQPQGIQGVGP